MRRELGGLPRYRGTMPGRREVARALRDRMTPAENRLWEALRDRREGGLKFRRQHAVGPYVLDFYCPAHKLVVEVDGGVHDTMVEYDAARTEYLNAYGYRVLRFRNDEVLSDINDVLRRIRQAAQTTEITTAS